MPPGAAALSPARGGRRRRAPFDLRAILRALRSLVERLTSAWRGQGRSGRLHRAEHPRPARFVLRRPPDRRGGRSDQISARLPRILSTSSITAARRSVCIHAHILDTRRRHPGPIARGRALRRPRGSRAPGWLDYEALITGASGGVCHIDRRERPADDQLHQRNDGTSKRCDDDPSDHLGQNSVGTLVHLHLTAADRYLWTLPMFHGTGWTFVWTVTAVGGTDICLRRVEPRSVFAADREEVVTMLCAAPDRPDRHRELPGGAAARGPTRGPGADSPARCRPPLRSSGSRASWLGHH